MKSKRISATELIITDKDGHTRLMLCCDPVEQAPRLSLFDSDGIERCVVTLTSEGLPIVSVYDGTTRPVAAAIADDDTVGIKMYKVDGTPKRHVEVRDEHVNVRTYDAAS